MPTYTPNYNLYQPAIDDENWGALVNGNFTVIDTVMESFSTALAGMSMSWSNIVGVPAVFPPSAHNQAWSTITATPTTLSGYGISDAASIDYTGHIPLAQLPASVQGAMYYVGVWNAATNIPVIASGAGYQGGFYKVSVAGSTLIDGNSTWNVGDLIIFDGAVWDKVDNYEAVTSVAGRTGAVTLLAGDIPALPYLPLSGGTMTGPLINSEVGAASTPALSITGAPYTGGTGTTTFPQLYLNSGVVAPSTFSTAGTEIGINAPSGFTGNFLDFRINGGTSLFKVDQNGALTISNTASNAQLVLLSNTITVGSLRCNNMTQMVISGYGAGSMGSAAVTAMGSFSVQPQNGATSGANQNSYGIGVTGNYWTSTASAQDNWMWQSLLGTGSNPASTLTLSHYGSTGTTSFALPSTTVSDLTVSPLTTPVIGTYATATTGGTLTQNTTYYYRVAAYDGSGQTLASVETSKSTGNTTATNTITINWAQVSGAQGYYVYGRTTGAEQLIATVIGGGVLSYIDNGSVTPSGAMPAANTTGNLITAAITGAAGQQIVIAPASGYNGKLSGTWQVGLLQGSGGGALQIISTTIPSADNVANLGQYNLRWANLLLSGTAQWGTGAAMDTGISRTSASTLAVGNGTAGDYSGSFLAGGFYSGNFQDNGGGFSYTTSKLRLACAAGVLSWSNTGAAWGTQDTGISRTAAGQVSVGNGTAGDTTGNLAANQASVNEIVALPLATPTNSAFATATTGGTLAPGTYWYRVAATDAVGITLASTQTSQVVPSGTSTNTVTVNWAQVAGATGYKVYGRTNNAELFMATIAGGNVLTWVDTGSVTPSGALPAANTTGIISVSGTGIFSGSGTNKATYAFGSSGFGFGMNGGDNSLNMYANTYNVLRLSGNLNQLQIPGNYMFCWNSGSFNIGTPDTSLSRTGAATVAVGNGTVGDTTGNLQLNKITKYNGNATAGLGVASIVAVVSLAGQTAAIGTTTMYTSTAGGVYRLSLNGYISVVGTAGTLAGTIAWSNGVSALSNSMWSPFSVTTTNSIAQQYPATIRLGAGQSLTYSTTFNSVTGSPQYGLDLILEQLA